MNKHTGLLLLVCLACGTLLKAQTKKLILIGIDGCRPDALVAANTPVLDTLMAHSTFSLYAQTIFPTVSGPGWSSMLTGVWYYKHGVTDNTFVGADYTDYPTFLTRLKKADSSYYTASISQWASINTYINNNVDYIYNASSGSDVAANAANLLATQDPDAIFLQFDDVDEAGHSSGFSPSNAEYIQAIEHVDTYVGQVLQAIESRPSYDQEEWFIMVSTDHGGVSITHGGNSTAEKTIFLIMNGAGLPHREILPVYSSTQILSAASFNGMDQYGVATAIPAYHFGTSTSFTIECRVKSSGWTGDPAILSDKDWNSGNNKGFVISGKTDGTTWKANVGDGSHRIDLNGGTINDNTFHHIALTVNRSGYAKLYQDGSLVDYTLAFSLGDITTAFPIGIAQDGTLHYPYYFNGMIDEVRIWNTDLSATTIKSWSCSPITSSHPDYSHLVGYWKFDEDTGSIAYDSSVNGNNISLSSDSMWVNLSESIQTTDYSQVPEMVDIAPTALQFFCIPIEKSWSLDGKSWLPSCGTTAVEEQTREQDVQLFPNPAASQITLRTLDSDASIRIYSGMGELMMVAGQYGGKERILNISSLPEGIYFVEIQQGNSLIRKKFIKVHH